MKKNNNLENDAVNEETKAAEAEAETAEATEADTVSEEEEASDPVSVAEAEAAEWKDKYLRLMAEYDNYRKRTAKEKESAYKDAEANAYKSLVEVMDNFDRAFSAEDSSPEDFKKGIEMTRNQLAAAFEKAGVSAFGEVGEVFDPNVHNAVMHIEDESLDANVIAAVFQKGYKMGDRVLRHAMVQVAN